MIVLDLHQKGTQRLIDHVVSVLRDLRAKEKHHRLQHITAGAIKRQHQSDKQLVGVGTAVQVFPSDNGKQDTDSNIDIFKTRDDGRQVFDHGGYTEGHKLIVSVITTLTGKHVGTELEHVDGNIGLHFRVAKHTKQRSSTSKVFSS